MRFSGTRGARARARPESVHYVRNGTAILSWVCYNLMTLAGFKYVLRAQNTWVLRGSLPPSDLASYTVVKGISPRERRGSLMVLGGRRVVQRHVVRRVVVARVVVVVVRVRIVVIILSRLRRLPLRVLLILHSSILKPYFYLSLCEVEVPREFPSLLLRYVRIEQKFFL